MYVCMYESMHACIHTCMYSYITVQMKSTVSIFVTFPVGCLRFILVLEYAADVRSMLIQRSQCYMFFAIILRFADQLGTF